MKSTGGYDFGLPVVPVVACCLLAAACAGFGLGLAVSAAAGGTYTREAVTQPTTPASAAAPLSPPSSTASAPAGGAAGEPGPIPAPQTGGPDVVPRAGDDRPAAVQSPSRAPIDLAVPVPGPVSSGYGHRWGRLHEGIDIASSHGHPVRAAARGVVRFAGYRGTYGYLVILSHEHDTETYYGHLSRILVRTGQKVEKGAVIGRVGSTGHSTGPHLHFEVRVRGRPLDPTYILGGLSFG